MPFYYGKRSAGICVVLGSKKASTYSSEYASGFFEPCAARLPAAPLPRNEGLLRQTPGRMLKKSTSLEKVEVQAKVETRRSALDLHSTSTSACLPAVVYRWVFA